MSLLPSDPVLAPETLDVVWFAGLDATRFLNDLISQEIGDMDAGETRRSFLLGPQGKLEFLLWVLVEDDRIGLATDQGRGEELAAALKRYRIRVDVEISLEAEHVTVILGGGKGWDVSWRGVPRRLVIGERPDLDQMSIEDYTNLRVAAGEPSWGVDVDESTIPHESGLVPASVDFTKGCFLGQELVARIDSRGGNVPRRLVRLRTDGSLETGSELISDGKSVGRVTTAAGEEGLGVVHRDISSGASVLMSGQSVVVEELPAKTHA